MAYIFGKGILYNDDFRFLIVWTLFIFLSRCEASQPLKTFYEARLILDPAEGAPLLMECNFVTSRCYASEKCSRTSSPVRDSIWFHNGIRLSMGIHGNQIHYDIAKATDQGNYQCASKSSGASLSESTRVYFTEPDIDAVPATVEVTLAGSRWQHEGGPFTLHCAGAGANVRRVTWKYEGYNIPSNHPFYYVSKIEQGMLQEKTIRSVLTFRQVHSQMTCEDLEKYSGIFQCSVEYEVTKSARDNEPFVIERRETKAITDIRALYKASNATTVLEPVLAFSPNILYLLCPLCVLHDVTMVTWSKEGKLLQNSSSLSYIDRNAGTTNNAVYSCESSGTRLDFTLNETNLLIKGEPEVVFFLAFWDRIEVNWRSNYEIPFLYVINMMYVSGSSVLYTNFFKKHTQEQRVSTFLDVSGEDIRFVAKTTVLDPFNNNQTLMESQHRKDIHVTVAAKGRPYVKSIAFWKYEGVVTFKKSLLDLDIVRCIKVNLTLTPEDSRSRRSTSEKVVLLKVGEDGILRADLTSSEPPWIITVPMVSLPTGEAAPVNLVGPFSPGLGIVIDAVFFAERSSGVSHILSQSTNTTVVASAPPPSDPDDGVTKSGFPWYILVGVIAFLAIVILVAAIVINTIKRKRKKNPALDHGERFDELEEPNTYEYLDYDQLTRMPDAPHLPPRPERQTESWPLPTSSDNTKKYVRPKSEMPARQLSETEYLLPITQRSKSAGATPVCSPSTELEYLVISDKDKSIDDEGIEIDSLFINDQQPDMRRPSREERESGYLSMTSRDSYKKYPNRRPQTHQGLPVIRSDSVPEQFEGPKRATVVPSRKELENMVDYELSKELVPKDEYVSNDDLSDDTILTLPNDESYASHNGGKDPSETNEPSPQNATESTSEPPPPKDSNYNSSRRKLSFRRSLIGRDGSVERNAANPHQSSENEVITRTSLGPPSVEVPKDQTYPIQGQRLSAPSNQTNPTEAQKISEPSESSRILSPVRYTDQMPQPQNTEAKQQPKDSTNSKPKVKTRTKKKKKKKKDDKQETESSAEPSAADSKRKKFSKHPSGTPAESSISKCEPYYPEGSPDNHEGSPDVHSPHAKSFEKQFSYAPPIVQDQNTQNPNVYMSRSETFV